MTYGLFRVRNKIRLLRLYLFSDREEDSMGVRVTPLSVSLTEVGPTVHFKGRSLGFVPRLQSPHKNYVVGLEGSKIGIYI